MTQSTFMFIVMLMDNDKRNAAVLIQPSRAVRTISLLTVVFAAGALLASIIESASLLSLLKDGRAYAEVPLEPGALQHMVDGWAGNSALAGTSYASVVVSGADPELTSAFVTPTLLQGILSATLSLLAIGVASAALRSRLSWTGLSRIVFWSGAVLATGTLFVQATQKSASQDLSIWLYAQDAAWLEPGFLSGMDFMPVAVGLCMLVAGWSLRSTKRFAEEADGVV